MRLLGKRIFFGAIVGLVLSACTVGAAFAAVPTTFSEEAQNNALISARNKVMYSIISECYNSLSNEINVTSGYITWSQIFDNGNAEFKIPHYLFGNSTVSSNPKMSCSEIMGGWRNFWGTQTFPGIGYRESDIPVPDNSGNFGTKEEMVSFLEKIGYSPTEESANEAEGYRCVSFSGTTPGGAIYSTDKICAKQSNDNENQIDLNYEIRVDDVSSDDLGDGNLDTMIFKVKSVDFSDGVLTIPKVGYDSWIFYDVGYPTHASTDNYYSCSTTYVPTPLIWDNNEGVTYNLCYKYGGFLGAFKSTGRLKVNNIKEMTYNDLARALGTALMTAKEAEPNNFPSFDSQDAMVSNAVIDPAIASYLEKGSFEDYMKYFMGNNYANYGGELTETEKYMLYWSGLKEVVTAYDGAANGNVEYWLVGTEFKDNYNLTCSSGCDITTLDRDGSLKTLKAISGSTPTVLELLNEIDYDSDDFGEVTVPEEDIYDDNVDTGTTTTPGGDTQKTCANSGGAMSLGWIVCPILDWLGEAATEVYDQYVEPSLQVEPQLFQPNTAGQNETKEAWNTFQSIANILFIILLLIVIFSQLTGVGIDNYGIKRILPKMIIAALLVNLSYYICVICVDISNILGNGFQELFNGLSPTEINSMAIDTEMNGTTTDLSLAPTAITGVAILGALVGMVGAIWANPAILLSLLVAALGIIIAIFFLFILLAAREAAIIVLIVISPLAFVCYMLPNTKKLFDRWLKMGQGLLLVYPICGLLVGGGDYVSRLLLSSGFAGGGFVAALTAMIVGVLPIFFIPMVLKTSFVAMGNLGAKISGFGDRVRGGADRKIRSAEGYKNAQRMGLERRTRIKAGLDKDGNLTARGERKAKRARSGFGRLTGADKRQAAYIAMARKDMASGEQADASLTNALARTGIASAEALPDEINGGDLFEQHTEGAYYGRQFLNAARENNISGMNAAIEAMRSSGMKSKDIAKLMRYAQNKGHFNGLNSNTKAAWLRDTAKRYGNDFLATDFELSSWAQAGGSLNGGVLGGYGDLAASGEIKMDDIKPEDVGKLSGDSLAGMAMAGLIDQSMAQRAIVSNPNLSVDKKIMLSAIANGAANSSTITSIQDFKSDAEQLMKNHANTVGLKTMNAVTEAMVDAWASVTPDSVNVVQNFEGGGRQINPVEVQIRGNNPNPPASSGSTDLGLASGSGPASSGGGSTT